MNFIKHIILFLFIVSGILNSCSTDKSEEKEVPPPEISAEKQKISAFWEAYRKAQKYRIDGQWKEAAQYYEQSLTINNEHEDSRFNLGNMYLELEQYKKAEQCWLDIVEVNPGSARSHMQLGRLYLSYERPETFDIEKARDEFLKTRELNRVITGPSMLLGHVALLKGEDNAAKDYFQSVIGSDIKSVEAYFLLGYLDWKIGNMDKAGQMFDLAVKYSTPEKSIDGTLSEGDTKDGISYLRPLNESLFHEYFKELFEIKNKDHEMIDHYQHMDTKLKEIKKGI